MKSVLECRILDQSYTGYAILQKTENFYMQEQGKNVTYRNLEHLHEKKEKLIEKLGEKYKELFESLIRSTE